MIDLNYYNQEELTIGLGKVQFSGILHALPFLLIFGGIYYYLWGSTLPKDLYKYYAENFGKFGLLILFGVMLSGIIVHELIHGITWARFATKGFQSMKFGVNWKYLTPYCHCNEPLLLKHYMIGTLMPGIMLGFVPGIIGICMGNLEIFVFGLFFTLAAGGDFMIANLLRKEQMDNLVQDHPTLAGCDIYRPKKD